MQLVLIEGNVLGADSTVTVDEAVPAEETATFDLTMSETDEAGTFESTWQLQRPDGEPVGDPFAVQVVLYVPAAPTATRPAVPTATLTPEAAEEQGPIDFNYFVHDCEYAGDDWRCWITFTPYGGIGQPYTFFVFDAAQPVRYYGGNADHFIQSRRCSAWVHEVKVQDDGGNANTKNIYISPNDYFSGGCVEP